MTNKLCKQCLHQLRLYAPLLLVFLVLLVAGSAEAGGTIQLAAVAEDIQSSVSAFARPAAGVLFIAGLIPHAWGRDFNGMTIGALVASGTLGMAAYAPNLLQLVPLQGGLVQ